MTGCAVLHGHAEEGFGGVADAFAANFAERSELGGAVAVVVDGRPVVDLWGGVADPATGAPWRRETRVPVFSTGKGLVSATVARAVSLGRFGFDDRVADHWPEFAANGKERITVRQILDHRSGVVLFGRRMRPADFADPDRVASVLAAARPAWTPGESWGYHLATYGDLVAEILRRTDPGRRPFARFFAEEVAAPLSLDVTFGTGGAIPPDLAPLSIAPPRKALSDLAFDQVSLLVAASLPFSLLQRVLFEVRRLDPDDPAWLAPAFPSGNAIASARSLATLYGDLATGGARLGIAPAVMAAILEPPEVPAKGDRDLVMGVHSRWRLGFSRPSPAFPYAASDRCIGMPGTGGSFAYADPDRRMGYAYVTNRLGLKPWDDPREQALRLALRDALSG